MLSTGPIGTRAAAATATQDKVEVLSSLNSNWQNGVEFEVTPPPLDI